MWTFNHKNSVHFYKYIKKWMKSVLNWRDGNTKVSPITFSTKTAWEWNANASFFANCDGTLIWNATNQNAVSGRGVFSQDTALPLVNSVRVNCFVNPIKDPERSRWGLHKKMDEEEELERLISNEAQGVLKSKKALEKPPPKPQSYSLLSYRWAVSALLGLWILLLLAIVKPVFLTSSSDTFRWKLAFFISILVSVLFYTKPHWGQAKDFVRKHTS